MNMTDSNVSSQAGSFLTSYSKPLLQHYSTMILRAPHSLSASGGQRVGSYDPTPQILFSSLFLISEPYIRPKRHPQIVMRPTGEIHRSEERRVGKECRSR